MTESSRCEIFFGLHEEKRSELDFQGFGVVPGIDGHCSSGSNLPHSLICRSTVGQVNRPSFDTSPAFRSFEQKSRGAKRH